MSLIQDIIARIDHADGWERHLELERQAFLKQPGTVDTNIYLVRSGCLQVYFSTEEEDHMIRLGYKDNLIVALDSFITGGPSSLVIQAIRKTQLKVISKSRFQKIIDTQDDHQQLKVQLFQLLILHHMEREKDILINSAAERYRRVLERSPRLFQEVPLRYIAAYLRMTPETLSRLKKS